MTIIVEDGTGLANSNSYCSQDDLDTYCDDRSITLAAGNADAALVRATTWIDNTYRTRFQGWPVKLRAQALQWPRIGVFDQNGIYVATDSIPKEIVQATCEAAIRELAEAGSLAPDLDRGGNIKELGAGSVRIVYGANASAQTTFQIIDGILAGLLGSPSAFTARTVRG